MENDEDVSKLFEQILNDAFRRLLEGENPRIIAWDICYIDFKKEKEKESDIDVDYLTRSLAIYLASWGMFRGSGELLGHNYLQFKKAVEIIVQSKCWKEDYSEEHLQTLYSDLKKEKYGDLVSQKMISAICGNNIPLDTMCRTGIKIIHAAYPDTIELPKDSTSLFGMSRLSTFPAIALDSPCNTIKYPKGRIADIFFFWIGYCAFVWKKAYKWLHPTIKDGKEYRPEYKKTTLKRYSSMFQLKQEVDASEVFFGALQDAISKVFPKPIFERLKEWAVSK